MTGLTPRKVAGYGYRRDLPDGRDLVLGSHPSATRPQSYDLRPKMPPVYDQGQLGSCTANAIGGADEFVAAHWGDQLGTPSRLFIYYGERSIEGTVDQDSGAQIRDGMKVLAKLGAPPEADWPYDIARFSERPPDQAFTDAKRHHAIRYWRCPQTVASIAGSIASGYPVVFGFTVYESFESPEVAQTGVVPMPSPDEQVMGGHAVLAVGYDDQARVFIVRNSWGDQWGKAGYFTMPYEYLLDAGLSSDLWTLRKVS